MSCPVLTPICKNYKPIARGQTEGLPDSKRDYEEQQERAKHGQQLMWDDAKGNPTTKPGGCLRSSTMENAHKFILLRGFVPQMKGSRCGHVM